MRDPLTFAELIDLQMIAAAKAMDNEFEKDILKCLKTPVREDFYKPAGEKLSRWALPSSDGRVKDQDVR